MLGAGLDKVLDGLDLGYVRFDLAVTYTVAEVYTLMHGNWHLDILIVRHRHRPGLLESGRYG